MSIASIPRLTPGVPNQHIVMENVSWDYYEALLKQAEGQHFQMTYDDGALEIMSPLPEHERVKQLLGVMVTQLALERNILMRQLGSTTYRNKKLRKALEPDQCFYVQNEQSVRSKRQIDLDTDPPPDLAIEVDVTHRSIARLPIYAALRVPEVWRYDGSKLIGLRLTHNEYDPEEMSLAFPFLRVAELDRFLKMWPDIDEMAVIRAFRDWVREEI